MLFLAVVTLACAPKEEDPKDTDTIEQGDTDTAVDTDTGPACGGVAPVVTDVTISNDGIKTYETSEGNVDYPTSLLEFNVTDADLDIHDLTFTVWVDTTLDGVVDTSGAGMAAAFDGAEDACTVGERNMRLGIPVDGSPTVDTLYEWAVVATDDAGYPSAPAIGVGYTPKADGTDGGPADTGGDTADDTGDATDSGAQ
jgi:hypothetical protein